MFSTCDFDVNGSSGESITSEFKLPRDCNTSSWVITAPTNHNVRLQFVTFQLSDIRLSGRPGIHPYMQIYDGLNTTDISLGVFTGARRPFTIQSSGRFMLVKLIFANSFCKLFLNNLKGVYTFNTTKGKPVTYMYSSSDQFKINIRKDARFLLIFCFLGMLVNITLMTNVIIQGATTVKIVITQSACAFTFTFIHFIVVFNGFDIYFILFLVFNF